MDGMNGDVGRGAKGAVRVVGAVGVSVRNLHGSQDDDQQHAEQRKENSPRSFGARLSAGSTHTLKLYLRMHGWERGMRGSVEQRAQGRLVEDGDAEGAGLVQFGAGVFARNDVVGLLADGA